ncbi:MAG: hypothetical protein HY975_02325 [Candidatus Kerfeldbacteria bacterium]|nr:hypothetical protein [Candidatus Kerfeldbacteria bacterium]
MRTREQRIIGSLIALMVVTLLFSPSAQPASAQPAADPDPAVEARTDFTSALTTTGGPAAAVPNTVQVSAAVNGGLPLQPFPHLAVYGGPNSSGWPFVGTMAKLGTCTNNPAIACAVNTDCGSPSYVCNNPASRPPPDTAVNTEVLDAYAKFSMAIVPITPLADTRQDILAAMRGRNPNQLLIGYAVGQITWCPQDSQGNIAYPVGSYYRDFYLGVTGGDTSCASTTNRLLWNQAGAHWGPANVNLAYRVEQPDHSYTYPVAEALAQVMYNYTKPSRGFDGLFIDIFCTNPLWAETAGDIVNYQRAGYGDPNDPNTNTDPQTRLDFADGWFAGHLRLSQRLRELADADGYSNYPVIANCGQSDSREFPYLNGWMRENFPFQNGSTFLSNLFFYPWGFLHQDYLFRAPQYNHIFTAAKPSTAPYTLLNQQKNRFGLGSTTLGNGYHALEDGAASPSINDYEFWWFDEWGVNTLVPQADPNYGRAMNGLAYTGWLGQPLGNMYNYLLPNTNPEIIPTNTFEQDVSRVHLITFNSASGSIERQTMLDAPVGDSVLHVRVDSVGDNYTSIDVNSDVFTATNGTYYSLTFWAKASKQRAIGLAIDGAGQTIPITDAWQKYQVSLKATATGNAIYQLQLGQDTGDIWFDHFQIQAGVGNVYRRDFERGTVLVNPYSIPLTVGLEKPFQKILGTVNPTLNNGAIVQSVTLTPDVGEGIGDAIFLLNRDTTAPGVIQDLR